MIDYTIVTVLFTVCAATVLSQEKFTLDTQVLLQETTQSNEVITKTPIQKLVCPDKIRVPIFSLPCNTEKDCRIFGPKLACCLDRCIRGILVPENSIPIRKPRISNLIEPPQKVSPVYQAATSTTSAPSTTTTATTTTTTTVSPPLKKRNLICPSKNARTPIFSLPCVADADCRVFGRGLLCCLNKCLAGIEPIINEKHSPALFGLVDRTCPEEPLAEILGVQECNQDLDCNPRICCQERTHRGLTAKKYCRTPSHRIERLPGARQLEGPLRQLASYMQCTAPPRVDLFPKSCESTLDCFPNLCCQEDGRKLCRPPKRSIISLVADVTTRIGAVEATKKFIERITK